MTPIMSGPMVVFLWLVGGYLLARFLMSAVSFVPRGNIEWMRSRGFFRCACCAVRVATEIVILTGDDGEADEPFAVCEECAAAVLD